mmetsp:Transcript_1858/g.2486  ORF Transcript_1858/g.2486 Transcript_1858/m.2486 type:complete len:391 (+) Transcript_1858:77-1249(+)|eukprot:CAMPEP_0195264728 /NCGR_PEP_ID=MMETSP0706-20130129/11022_1 /TAXON_ID=33640 /ORGANISM="Asterionellopsis glacialis, Strain CCMP134" /LENGTH=390 /DNA_ID=CAMNT_0040319053 /DNA_START=40 /DNA_END=1212 /DNA_ORIENTATION=-
MKIQSHRSIIATVAVVLFSRKIGCRGFSIEKPTTTTSATLSSPILIASPENDGNSSDVPKFDVGCVANPVILPPCTDGGEWQCYYYGNAGSWNHGHKCFLPTGSSGLATSKDGFSWTKVFSDKTTDGTILGPSENGWDSVHTGVGDVIRVPGKDTDELHMYYFGGDDEEISFGLAGGSVVGFRMRIGRAKSYDNGRTWTKDDTFLLDYDESEGFFASWPRIVAFDDDNKTPWKMFYHAFNGKKWKVFGAESTDGGDTWIRTGLVLEGSESEDDFDFSGIGTRDITQWKDGLLMIYEGVGQKGIHRLGAAYCDSNDNKWRKLNDGKPILEPGKGPLGEWTKQVIGTPYVLHMPDGSLRIYHCAKNAPDAKMSIGVVVSESGGIEPDCWTAV